MLHPFNRLSIESALHHRNMNSIKIANILSIIWMSLHCLGGGCSALQSSGVDPEGMRSAMIDTALRNYKVLADSPTLLSARIGKTGDGKTTVKTMWSKRNLDRVTTQKFTQDHTLDSNFQVVSESFLVDVSTELFSSTTDANEKKAVLRQVTTDGTVRQYLEFYLPGRTTKHYDLSALGVHGDVYTDSVFGSFEWSPDQTKLLYIAEKKVAKSAPFYNPAEKSSSGTQRDSVNVTKGDQYVFKPDWGDQLVGKRNPVIVVVDTKLDTVRVLPGVPKGFSPGQVSWAPDSEGVVGVAWQHEPRYLGLKGSMNIHSWIFLLENGKFSKISNDGNAVWSPRFNIDRTRLVWMERNFSLPHHNNYRLMATTWNQSTISPPEIIVDIINKHITISNGKKFFGLYWLEHARRCWIDSENMVVSTVNYAIMKSYIINIATKVMTEIENGNTSMIVSDVYGDLIAFVRTSSLTPDQLVLARLNSLDSNSGDFDLIEVTTPGPIEELKNLEYKIVHYTYNNNDEVKDFNFVYVGPKSGETASIPLIVWPHGGPQGASYVSYKMEVALYASLGIGVLVVNYRGSAGMGADNLQYLLGRVASSDVIDFVTATEEALIMFPWLDPERVACYGGSYGGFMVAHVTGQHPMLCKAAVMKGPVTNLALARDTSDVTDLFTYLLGYDLDVLTSKPPDVEMYMKMYESSPIVNVPQVITPTLICVGAADLRTPMSQGSSWYNGLIVNGVIAKMLVYDDNHALSAPRTEIDLIINIWLWILEHIPLGPV